MPTVLTSRQKHGIFSVRNEGKMISDFFFDHALKKKPILPTRNGQHPANTTAKPESSAQKYAQARIDTKKPEKQNLSTIMLSGPRPSRIEHYHSLNRGNPRHLQLHLQTTRVPRCQGQCALVTGDNIMDNIQPQARTRCLLIESHATL